jgi:uncharacterized protein
MRRTSIPFASSCLGTSILAVSLAAIGPVVAGINPYSDGARAELAQDYVAALDCYSLAAKAGVTDAMYALGRIYAEVYADDAEAFRWYQEAAKQGNAFAQFALGQIYLEGNTVTAPDPELAAYWLESAATQGRSPDAAFALFESDPYAEDAARWLTQAAEAGRLAAMARLAAAYANGDYGLPVDPVQSATWRRRVGAAEE